MSKNQTKVDKDVGQNRGTLVNIPKVFKEKPKAGNWM